MPSEFTVVAVKTPEAPSDLRVTSVTHEQVSLAWGASQSEVTNYIIAMREVGKKKSKTVAKVDGSKLTCSLATGFEQNQEYIFRVYAENEVIKYLDYYYAAEPSRVSVEFKCCYILALSLHIPSKLLNSSFKISVTKTNGNTSIEINISFSIADVNVSLKILRTV